MTAAPHRRVVGGDQALRRLARGVTWSVVGAGLGRGLTLLAAVIVARMLGPSLFGEWGATQATVITLSGVASVGASITAAKHVAQFRNTDPDRAGGRATLALVAAAGGAAMGALVLVLAAQPIAVGILTHASLVPLLRLSAGALLFATLGGAQLGVLGGLENFGLVCIVNVVRGVAVTGFMIGGAWAFGVAGAVAGLSTGELLGAAAGHAAVRRATHSAGVPLRATLAWRERSTLWRFSLPVLLASFAVGPAMWLGQVLLLRQPSGLTQVGYFAYSYRWYLFALFFTSALSSVGLPVLTNLRATAGRESNARFFRINLYSNLTLAAGPALLLIVFAGTVARFGGAAYRPIIPTVIVLATACIPTALNNVLSQAALSMDRVRIWVMSDVILAVTVALVALVLVPRLGSLGLAYAYLAGMIATCVVLIGPVSPRMRGLDRWDTRPASVSVAPIESGE